MPEVKRFINVDLPLYHDVEYIPKGGAPPYIYFLDEDDEEIERVDLEDLSQDECNEELSSRGFIKKSSKEEELPEEVINNLKYKRSDEL